MDDDDGVIVRSGVLAATILEALEDEDIRHGFSDLARHALELIGRLETRGVDRRSAIGAIFGTLARDVSA